MTHVAVEQWCAEFEVTFAEPESAIQRIFAVVCFGELARTFYESRLGVKAELPLALLNAADWKRVTGNDYSLPQVGGTPPVIMMPATSDNPVYGLMDARKAAIPPEQLQTYLNDHHTTFNAMAADFVDFLGFHEIGHMFIGRSALIRRITGLTSFSPPTGVTCTSPNGNPNGRLHSLCWGGLRVSGRRTPHWRILSASTLGWMIMGGIRECSKYTSERSPRSWA
jgi:hypothetical protein